MAKTGRAPDPDIRMRILRFLKGRGAATLRDAARHLRLSHEGVRKQMVIMEANGWVSRAAVEVATRHKGRPTEAYSVTPAGDRLFPKAYNRLSSDIIAGIAAAGGPEMVRKVLAALADRQVEAWRPLLAGKSPRDKLEALKGLYFKDDPFMSVETEGDELILIERNCPFLDVAMEHPAMCSLSVRTLERLLEHPVVRTERFQGGQGRCLFRIRLDREAPARKGFLLEDERAGT